MKSFNELTQPEILALAISSEEEGWPNLWRFRGRVAGASS